MGLEIWVDIVGWESFYQVSNYGRIKSKQRVANGKSGSKRILPEKILDCIPNNNGYRCVILMSKGVLKERQSVHRLVAKHFIPNPLMLAEVNHIDLNKLNNYVYNLEWVTKQQNIKHAKDNGVYKKNAENLVEDRKSKMKPVLQYDLEWNFISEWESIRSAARAIGVRHCLILNQLNGFKGISRVHNFRFKYK